MYQFGHNCTSRHHLSISEAELFDDQQNMLHYHDLNFIYSLPPMFNCFSILNMKKKGDSL